MTLHDDDYKEMAAAPSAPSLWTENELRRLYADREDWRIRWQDLKHWLSTRRNVLDWKTLGMIEHHMSELEKDAAVQFTIIAKDADRQTKD